MTVPTNMQDLSTTESANSPTGSENPVSTDNHLRAIGAIVRRTNAKGADIASSGTTDIGAATGEFIDVTGTTTITGLGTIAAGITRTVRFTGALTLTHNASSLILPSSANITTANGDVATFRSLGSGNWKCISYTKQDGSALVADSNASKADLTGATFTGEVEVPDDAYDESTWDANNEVPTKNALRDEIESIKASLVQKFTSSAKTITRGTTLTVAHGLSEEPFDYFAYLVCTTAEHGYSIGDKIKVGTSNHTASSSTNDAGATLRIDDTNVYVIIADEGFWTLDKSTNDRAQLTDGSWDLYVRAWV